jgi:surface protein
MKFTQLFNFIGIIVFFSSSIAIGQTTYQLEWGFNINGVDASLTIEPGDTVEWIWIDTGQHNVVNTANAVETFDSGLLQGVGTIFSHTFTEIGVNDYHCTPHNDNMFGTITVTTPVSSDGLSCATALVAVPGVYNDAAITEGTGSATEGDELSALWYVYTAEASGSIDINSCISDPAGIDTRLWVWTDGCDTLTQLAFNDDDCGLGSAVSDIPVVAEQEYLIEWDDRWGADQFDWELTFTPASLNDFYLATNGVTCMCPDAAVGDTGDPGNGIVYTKRGRNDITSQNASTSCTSGITDMSSLFNQVIFNEDISSWDVSNVTDMNQMFAESFAFNQPIDFWDVSAVTNMNGMFFFASGFNQPIGDWDVSQVTDLSSMFNGGSFNQPIDDWNVSNVTQMSGMFFDNSAFNQPLNSWNTSNVGNMQSMFSGASSFNQDLNSWNVSSVVQMAEMFSGSAMNGLIDSWDVSSVIDMRGMFQFSLFNQDLNNWDVSSVQNMEEMFWESSFNQPIGDWNVLNVLNMYNMFIFTNFNQDISNWQFNTSVNLQGMMNHTLISIENYDLLLASMYNQPLVNKEFGDFSLSFCNISDHDALINEKGWTFEGGQPVSTFIIAPPPVNLEVDQGSCLATGVELGSPSASGCGILTITNDAPIEFPLGITEVTWTVTDDNGNIESSSQTVEVYMISDQADLCYVSADENQPQNNRVFITSDPGLSGQNVDFHEVLREGTSGYETIGFIVPPEESFLDTTSDNNTQAYRYKVQTTDICGQQLTLSDFHKTILLQSGIATDNSVNLAWTPYLGYTFSSYNVYRSVNGGSYELLTSLASTNTSYNDTSADVENNFYEYYISIDVGSCGTSPLQSFELKSNREFVNPNLSIGNNTWLNKTIILYPNPTTEIINVSTTNDVEVRSVLLYSAKGHKVIEVDKTGPIDVSGLSEGIYYVTIKTNQGLVSKSVIKK